MSYWRVQAGSSGVPDTTTARRLPAAEVAALALRCPERREEPVDERHAGACHAASIAGQTDGRSIMFAWIATPSAVTWPAASTHEAPVHDAAPPFASTIPTWRTSRPGSVVEQAPERIGRGDAGPQQRQAVRAVGDPR